MGRHLLTPSDWISVDAYQTHFAPMVGLCHSQTYPFVVFTSPQQANVELSKLSVSLQVLTSGRYLFVLRFEVCITPKKVGHGGRNQRNGNPQQQLNSNKASHTAHQQNTAKSKHDN